jgi:hypothetical protein
LENYPHLVPSIKAPALWVWGDGCNGELGTNSVIRVSSPIQTISGGTNWKQVCANNYTQAGIKTDGTLWLWGYNGYGFLGINDTSILLISSPIQTISGGTDWKQVSIGQQVVTAIKTDGTLWGWGYNYYGPLGTGDNINRSSPVQTISGGTNWKQVSVGNSTAAIKTDGTLWTWGNNLYGQLGDAGGVDRSSPVQTVSGGNNWKSVSSGSFHMSGIKTDGTLWIWGNNGNGQLGDNTLISKSSPVQTASGGNNWKSTVSSTFNTAAIKTDGTLWIWGRNHYGQIGTGNTIDRSTPVQTVSGGTNWLKVNLATSYQGSSASGIKTNGTLWVWGFNGRGQLGTEDIIDRSSPVQTVSGGTGWKDVNMSFKNTMAIKDEDDL